MCAVVGAVPTLCFAQFELNSSQFGIPLAEACRQLCCNTAGCAFWTATDPQPYTTEHLCYLKEGDGQLLPNGCAHYSSGHCWSGAVRAACTVQVHVVGGGCGPPCIAVRRSLAFSGVAAALSNTCMRAWAQLQ
jgi:hypothetical protein